MLKAVIFDMDGVIIDSEYIHAGVEKALFKSLGFEISEEEHNSYVGVTTKSMWQKLKDKYGLSQDVDELVRMNKDSYISTLTGIVGLKPIPGAVELIRDLHANGIKIGLATSSNFREIEAIIGRFNLKSYFHTLTSGEEVANGKPAPDTFLLAAERLGCKPEECVVIEDSNNGVTAAKAGNMKCIGFKAPNSRNQDLSAADMVVGSLLQLDCKVIASLFK
jgi:beta-phosphoglucomutase family hydrolase